MDERAALDSLAAALGVHREYTDGLRRTVTVEPETLVAVCASLGAPLERVSEAPEALRANREAAARPPLLQPVTVAWDGVLRPQRVATSGPVHATILLESGETVPVQELAGTVQARRRLPAGYHELRVVVDGRETTGRIIAAPTAAWRRTGRHRSWGVGTHLAALRSSRSRAVGDLRDLATLCRWVGDRDGDLVTVLPLLPTFNDDPAEPSPYSPVSRLFWSELILDGGDALPPAGRVERLDVERAAAEVRRFVEGLHPPGDSRPASPNAPPSATDELDRYARFRGAQARLGRNWRDWPRAAREGRLDDAHVDPIEERFHRVAQREVRRQLEALTDTLDEAGVRLGLDLSVGVHPDGYDPWRHPDLFAPGMSVGAPPDPGFPGGQDWGFAPLLPEASRAEGHRYLAACVAHQARLAGVLRIDHVMAFNRLYWIPRGFDLHQGTYVDYPTDELFAVLCLESHRNRCEIVGENLGTVPPAIDAALHRHGIVGMSLALFEAASDEPRAPGPRDMALIGTHDTPTFAGWLEGRDIDERLRAGLLDADAAPAEREARRGAVERLAETLGGSSDDPADLLERVLAWLGGSASPLVTPWLEDLWLEPEQVNLPGTSSWARPNWQRPMRRLLDEVLADPSVLARVEILRSSRRSSPASP